MRYCPNCQTQFDDSMVFCSNCGTALVQQAQPNYYQQPQPQPGVIYPQPVPVDHTKPSKARTIVGMIMSLCGLEGGAVSLILFMWLGFFGALFQLIDGSTEGQIVMSGLSTFYSVFFAIFSLPFSIIGLTMSKRSIAMGSQSKMCKVGRITGIIGLIITIVPVVISFLSLVPYMA